MSNFHDGNSAYGQDATFQANSQFQTANSQFPPGTSNSSLPSAQSRYESIFQQLTFDISPFYSDTQRDIYSSRPYIPRSRDFPTTNIASPRFYLNDPHRSNSSSVQYNNVSCSGIFVSNPFPSSLSSAGSLAPANSILQNSSNNSSPKMHPLMEPVDEQIWHYVRVVMKSSDPVCVCPICLEDCIPGSEDRDMLVVGFVECNDHQLHLGCLNRMVEAKKTPDSQSLYLECPHCMKKYGCGVKTGNQPPGKMTCSIMNQSLPGHPQTKTIQITYQISSGIQGSEHPNPGRPYSASNFPRSCYLPDTEKGRLVRDLLKIAFDRKLIFTVGTSATTGRSDVVIWNDIHHKTEWNDYSGHGYPDPEYLDRCLCELANQGVSQQDLSVHKRDSN